MASRPEGGRPPLRRDGDFVRLWAGQTVSELGSQVTIVALPLAAILVLHASAFEVAVLSSFEFVPFLLFGLVAGAWVDRRDQRRVLIGADLGRAVVLGSVPLAYAFDALTLPHLYAAGFLAGTLTVLFSLAYQAYLPALLEREQLVEANGKLESTRSVAQTAGPAAGGGLVSLFSAPVALLADASSFVLSAALLVSMRRSPGPAAPAERTTLGAQVREGLTFVWREPILRANLYSSGLANFGFGIVWAVLFVFAVRELELSAGAIGVILGLGQAGGIAGATLAARIARRLGVGRVLVGAVALVGPSMALVALASPGTALVLVTAGWALLSFSSRTTAVVGVSVRQALVPQRLQGRVVGATRSIILGVIPLGSLAGGALAAAAGTRTAIAVGALSATIAFVPLLLSPARALRELPATAPEPAPA
jgi:MFS family permease